MAVASTHHESFAFDLGTGAHTNDLQGFAVAVADTLDHVGDEGAAQAVALTGDALGARGGDHDGVVVLADADAFRKGALQFAFGSFHLDGETVEGNRDLFGDGNRVFADS